MRQVSSPTKIEAVDTAAVEIASSMGKQGRAGEGASEWKCLLGVGAASDAALDHSAGRDATGPATA